MSQRLEEYIKPEHLAQIFLMKNEGTITHKTAKLLIDTYVFVNMCKKMGLQKKEVLNAFDT